MTKTRNLFFKNVLLVIVFSLFCVSSLAFVHADELEGYELEYYDNAYFRLEDGVYESNTSWATTQRIAVRNGDIIPTLPYAHYILFWNNMSIYMGYYQVDGEINSLSTCLGIWPGGAIELTGVKTFALVINKDDVDTNISTYYGVQLSTYTFQEVFGNPTYLNYTDSVLTDNLSNTLGSPTYGTYTDGNLPDTLTDSFTTNVVLATDNLNENINFTDTDLDGFADGWTASDGDGSIANGFQRLTATIDGFTETMTYEVDFITGHEYFFSIKTSAFTQGGSVEAQLLGGMGADSLFFFSTLAVETQQVFFTATTNRQYLGFRTDSGFNDNEYFEVSDIYILDLTVLQGAYPYVPTGHPDFTDFFNDFRDGLGAYEVENLADDNNISYEDLLTEVEANGVSTYALTRVLPTNLITNGDFNSDLSGWSLLGVSPVWDNGKVKMFNTVTSALSQAESISSDQKIFASYDYQVSRFVAGNMGLQLRYSGTIDLNFLCPSSIGTGFYSSIQTTLNNDTDIWLGNTNSANADTYFDNIKVYNVSSLISSGLFTGLSDSAIKIILDDYAVNGLTSSNVGYFFDGPSTWDNLSISAKNNILSYYNISTQTAPEVIDFTDTDFTDNYVIFDYGVNWTNNVIISRIETGWTTETPAEVLDYLITNSWDSWGGGNPAGDFESVFLVDWTRRAVYWASLLTETQRIFYRDLLFDSYDPVERYEWYQDYGVTALNFAYYYDLWEEAVLEVDRWEWYSIYGVNSFLYTPMLDIYADLQNEVPITYEDFLTNEVYYLVAPEEIPEDLGPGIDSIFGELGFSDTLKFIIGIVVIGALFIIIAIKHGAWQYYALIGYLGYIVFALIGWFVWWVALIFVALETLILYLTVFK